MLSLLARLGTIGLCLAAMLATGATALSAKTYVYVSDAEDGAIDSYALDPASGALTSLGKTEAGKLVMPMTVSPNKKFLYAVVRSQPFRVLTYAIDPATGKLTQKASAPLPDSMPYVSTDATGRLLFTCSYGGDKIAVSPIGANGLVETQATQVIPTGRNAHAIRADRTNRYVFVTTLGANKVLQFKLDPKSGKLEPNTPPSVDARKDHGPRHMVFSPNNHYLYVLNELSGHVAQFALDSRTGTLKEVDSVASVPADAGLAPGVPQAPIGPSSQAAPAAQPKSDDKPKIWAADIQITPNGRFLYTTERTQSKIALFTVTGRTGKLRYVTNLATEKQPRGIKIDPSGHFLVAAGEKSDRLSVYRIDSRSGTLSEVGRYPVGKGANWIEIIDLP